MNKWIRLFADHKAINLTIIDFQSEFAWVNLFIFNIFIATPSSYITRDAFISLFTNIISIDIVTIYWISLLI